MERKRKSKRKLRSIYVMLVLTAALMIVSTYAWFSVNREVSITGITAYVAAAEGLQISIDGVKWGSSVTVDDTTLAAANKDANNDPINVNRYVWPQQLEPVSTDGSYTNGDLNFYYGTISPDGAVLKGIDKATDADSKYIAFDVYLKNSSSNANGDKLQLSTGSEISINTLQGGKNNTGLENSVRAGLMLYADKAMFTAALGDYVDQKTDASSNRTIAGIQPTGTDDNSNTVYPKVSIWEPNYNQHISEVVQNDDRITANPYRFQTRAMNSASFSRNIDGVNATDVNAGVSVNDSGVAIEADANEGPYMTIPNTIETGASISGSPIDMTDVSTSQAQLMLLPNSIMKARIYIWLEGQDPDCMDTASTGRAFDIQMNLCKPAPDSNSNSGNQQQGGGQEGGGQEGGGQEGGGNNEP